MYEEIKLDHAELEKIAKFYEIDLEQIQFIESIGNCFFCPEERKLKKLCVVHDGFSLIQKQRYILNSFAQDVKNSILLAKYIKGKSTEAIFFDSVPEFILDKYQKRETI